MIRPLLFALTTSLLTAPALAARKRAPDLDAVAAELLGRAQLSTEAYDELRYLCDHIGHRLSGSPQLNQAITWAADQMAQDGLTVTQEPVMVPHWVRGEQLVEVQAPANRPLNVLTLGNSVGTEGLTADVVVVSSFDELSALGDAVKGKIVLYDVPWMGYGPTVAYRWEGPAAAQAAGAVAVMIRSVTPESLQSPHTGSTDHQGDGTDIPAVAVTIEDATWIHRLTQAGETVTVHMRLGAQHLEEVPSANVIGELRGRETPDEIVVLGCHLDSWDVGQGAQDDGAGCVTVMEAVAQLAALPVPPRRTVRAVLYTNEENGLAGGRAYAQAHAGERFIAAVEADTGSGQPIGFGVDVRDGDGQFDEARTAALAAQLAPWSRYLNPVGAGQLVPGHSGADIGPLVATGVPGFGLKHDMTNYWPIHHTRADTFDKVDPELLARNVAAMTVFAWLLAESPEPITSPQP